MKITSVIARTSNYPLKTLPVLQTMPLMQNSSDVFEKNNNVQVRPYNTVSFLGYNVHILDGGVHADNMRHFAQAISSDMDIVMHDVQTNPKSPYDKQMKSLYEQLKTIPRKSTSSPEYIALPGLFNISLQNVQDQYERVMGEEIKITPENVKSNKKKIIAFLKKISDNPDGYKNYIGYMDPNGQGVEWIHEVITEINRLIKEGYRVYVPSGHPEYQSLKWLADERGKKPELQHFISRGVDKDDSVKVMRTYIQNQDWYDFNLLNLSDAHTVNLKGADGKDYLYAAYDSTVTDGARGVYNFYPVRDSAGKVKGYSYTDETTVQYPYDEFPSNDEIAHISQFVGKRISAVKASAEQLEEFMELRKTSPTQAKEKFSSVLFDVKDVFTPDEIKSQKIDLKGKYTDSSSRLFFDTNGYSEITFPSCNCEGSFRPSVLSMWGSCFSIFNAIKKDIEQEDEYEALGLNRLPTIGWTPIPKEIETLLTEARAAEKSGRNRDAENYYNRALEKAKTVKFGVAGIEKEFGDFHFRNANYEHAGACFNNVLNSNCATIFQTLVACECKEKSLSDFKNSFIMFNKAKQQEEEHDKAVEQYNSRSFRYKFFNSPPQKPIVKSWNFAHGKNLYESSMLISSVYNKLATVCEKKCEPYPAKVCRAAAQDIKDCTPRGDKVMERRAEGIQYIGDLYPEIKPE